MHMQKSGWITVASLTSLEWCLQGKWPHVSASFRLVNYYIIYNSAREIQYFAGISPLKSQKLMKPIEIPHFGGMIMFLSKPPLTLQIYQRLFPAARSPLVVRRCASAAAVAWPSNTSVSSRNCCASDARCLGWRNWVTPWHLEKWWKMLDNPMKIYGNAMECMIWKNVRKQWNTEKMVDREFPKHLGSKWKQWHRWTHVRQGESLKLDCWSPEIAMEREREGDE